MAQEDTLGVRGTLVQKLGAEGLKYDSHFSSLQKNTFLRILCIYVFSKTDFFDILKLHRNFATSGAPLALFVSEILAFEVNPKFQSIFGT